MENNNMILEFNINGCRDTDYTYVHIMNNGAKVCVHFPSIRMGERVERFDSYYEAEQYALKYNASRNMIDENDIVLATVDTSVYNLDNNTGIMTGAFIIKDANGNTLDEVVYEPEENILHKTLNLGLTDVAEIKTVIYMLSYIKKHGYNNVIINHDNKKIKEIARFDNNIMTKAELEMANMMRRKIASINGEVFFQHLKSHTGHRTLDSVDKLAKKMNKKNFMTLQKAM